MAETIVARAGKGSPASRVENVAVVTWFAGPMLLAGLGLPVPGLICFAVLGTVRLTRSIGIGPMIYLVVFLAVGVVAR